MVQVVSYGSAESEDAGLNLALDGISFFQTGNYESDVLFIYFVFAFVKSGYT